MQVAVAVSGGADSLLALSLLQEQGHAPLAVHALFVDQDEGQRNMRRDLARVCARMGLDLQVCDLRQDFGQKVIVPFVQAYARGMTPNPCSWCNQRIKFGRLAETVRDMGVSHLATGHYARLSLDCVHPPGLFRGDDAGKDQSYFLALMPRAQLEVTHFPLAGWKKDQVRAALQERGIQSCAGRESQEICFIPENDYRFFLENQEVTLPGPGPIVDVQGHVLGRHQGLYAYTLGQRRGLGIAFSQPLYVLEKQRETNTLIVGPRSSLQARSFRVRGMNELLPLAHWPQEIWVQTNYRQGPKRVWVQGGPQELEVTFEQVQRPATPGQIAAFYSSQGRVLGGGEIA